MGRYSSPFSEKAGKESAMRAKDAKYNENIKKHGQGIDWSTLSAPVLSGVTPEGKILIRQVGRGDTVLRYDQNGKPIYEKIGVQSIYNSDPETGALSPSDELPQIIRFRAPMIPPTYMSQWADANKYWRKQSDRIKSLMNDWAEMIRDKTEDLPAMDAMPLFERDYDFRGDRFRDDRRYYEDEDNGHRFNADGIRKDKFHDYEDTSYADDIEKYDRDHSDIGTIVSDMNMKDVKRYHSYLSGRIKQAKTMRNIIGACSRKY